MQSDDVTSRHWTPFRRAERPYVVFAATTQREAVRLYRAQNLMWVWIGLAAILAAVAYFVRPALGPVPTTDSPLFGMTRELLVAVGGGLICVGVWTIRRALEVMGHVSFTTGALMNAVTALAVPGGTGGRVLAVVTLTGLAFTSAYRAYFIVRWIGSDAGRGA